MRIAFPYPGYEDIAPVEVPDANLLGARVRPTLEVVIEESPAHLRRVPDESTGLMLLAP
jgi:hypothetical protein